MTPFCRRSSPCSHAEPADTAVVDGLPTSCSGVKTNVLFIACRHFLPGSLAARSGASCQIPLCESRSPTGLQHPDTIGVFDLDLHFRTTTPNVVTLSQRVQKPRLGDAARGQDLSL